MAEVLLLGYLGFKTNQLDGQTVKTRNLLSLLKRNNIEYDFFDTQDLSFNLKSYFILLNKIRRAKTVYYLPAQRNLTYLFPVLYIITKLLNIKIFYFVVGGWLIEFLREKPIHRELLKRIHKILPETKYMLVNMCKQYQFENLLLFPNFRFNQTRLAIKKQESHVFKMVFMSRIIKEKGLDELEHLCAHIDSQNNNKEFVIDFYGPIAKKDDFQFQKMIQKYSFTKYKGILEPSEIIQTISIYDVLLLPTRYYTEGLPGAIVDAYMAGIPVIVTKWKHATEFVRHQVTGIIIPFHKPSKHLIEAVYSLSYDKRRLNTMKKRASEEAVYYSETTALEILNRIIT